MSAQPKHILYLRSDTIGDLVIFSSALIQLKAAWPEARHTLVVRSGYETLASLFPASLGWQVAKFNPFVQRPSECRAELDTLLTELDRLEPDVIVASTIHRTWLEIAVAARFPQARRVVLGDRALEPFFAEALQLDLGVDPAKAFDEIVPIADGARDWENNHRLVHHLAGRLLPRSAPQLSVPPTTAAEALQILRVKQLPTGKWAAVFPAGLANVPIKQWPVEKFAALVLWLQDERKTPVLLLGHTSEAAILNAVADGVVQLGGTKPAIWLGRDGEVPLLAGLLAAAKFYVGHDTGAMHIAAAVGRPVVGIFGGGHWPRFRPVGRQAVSVVEPLPCFGCNWDCTFGDAPCVKTINPIDVQNGVDRVLNAGDADFDIVAEVQNLQPEALQLIAAVNPRYRALQQDRVEQQDKIEELKAETDTKDIEIAALKNEANTKDAEIGSLKNEADTKDTEIATLKRETDTKDAEIAALKQAATDIKTELEAECAGKDQEIAQLKREADGKDAEIAALKQTSNEREQLIFTLDGHVKNFQKMVAELRDEKDRIVASLNEEIARRGANQAAREAEIAPKLERLKHLEWVYSQLPETADPTRIAHAIEAKDTHIRNIEALVTLREQEMAQVRALFAEKEQVIANYAAGLHAFEGSKHYGRLLAEKEAVIQSLHKACMEREAVIRQLATEATGFGPRVAKLSTATKAHWRLKWWAPFNDWLFKKVVENYWMQIGVLRHYEPRPLVWDKIPKPTLPAEQLPQIGIVTPSYGQPAFIESTMLSVLNQRYPKLHYVVQDGGSKDASPEIIARHASKLAHWESVPDKGQADAVKKGFEHLKDRLGPDDVMAWLNSDDFIAPRVLNFVAEYFVKHPEVDCVYGHRIIIDEKDRDIGRWIMPRHDPRSLEWIDYVPQETLFWRKRAWDLIGGIDPSFQFALDWDPLARFTQAKLRIVRLPYFLGCFRVHPTQKTSSAIHTTGAEEMKRVRARFHGTEKPDDMEKITAWARRVRFRGGLTARLHALGIRW